MLWCFHPNLGKTHLLVFVKQKNQQHKEDSQNASRSSQGGSEELVCTSG